MDGKAKRARTFALNAIPHRGERKSDSSAWHVAIWSVPRGRVNRAISMFHAPKAARKLLFVFRDFHPVQFQDMSNAILRKVLTGESYQHVSLIQCRY